MPRHPPYAFGSLTINLEDHVLATALNRTPIPKDWNLVVRPEVPGKGTWVDNEDTWKFVIGLRRVGDDELVSLWFVLR